MGPIDDEKPPRPGRGLLKRAALGAILIFALSAGTVASAGLLEVDRLITIVKSESAPIPGIEGALDNVDPGTPQTILVLGSDRRFKDIKEKNPVRSDTMLLVRLDPSRRVTAVMSIPRDLKVNIKLRNGNVVTDKINAAYALGGPRLSVSTVRDLLHIPIHHVVNVNFGGFQRAVNRLGCVYVDVDKDYFNDNNPPNGSQFDYATIDINPGYQKLCGSDSLDYVRYRHFDDDFVRAARQQSFLAQAKEQIGLGRVFGDRGELLRIFGRYTQTDIARENTSAILRLLKLAFESSKNPIREVHFRGDIGETYVTITPDNLRKTVDEFRNAQASNGPRAGGAASGSGKGSSRRSARRRPLSQARGVIFSKVEGENFVADASTRLSFPVYYPRARLSRGRYLYGKPRVYDVFDRGQHRHRAYRIVVSTGRQGQYYGIQGTNWKSPPILDNPSTTARMAGRTYELFTDGNRLALVAWRTRRAVYWVSNTLSRTLTNSQMLAIARSLGRVGDR
ncbi:MAG: polyisoprenyl-teichoic acid--peptidoglycan teichoic acid transferase [Solirubrobacteraceae bacterium]|nr:polyisoprenyl-teichoic acid--peptidoglycan teichoic acid transferase [Solirubrobacteraceae bacterium]